MYLVINFPQSPSPIIFSSVPANPDCRSIPDSVGSQQVLSLEMSSSTHIRPQHNHSCLVMFKPSLSKRCALSVPVMCPQDIWLGLATPNLHHLVCQLAIQERMLGDTVQHAEVWVERCIQEAKRCVKFKTTCHPEKVIGGQELVKRALAAARYNFTVPLLCMDELWEAQKKRKADSLDDNAYDSERHDPELSAMRDKGVECTLQQWSALRDRLILCVRNNSDTMEERDADIEHLQQEPFPVQDVFWHKMASLRGEWCVTSTRYKRQKRSQSYWVLAEYDNKQHVGRISQYVRVPLPPASGGQARELKVALCDFWAYKAPWVNRNTGGPIHRVLYKSDPPSKNYVVKLDSISCPVIHTWNMDEGKKQMLFASYDFQSGMKS